MSPVEVTGIIPSRIRWLAIALGCVAAPIGLGATLIFPIYLAPLILGTIIQPYARRSGRLLMWVGTLIVNLIAVLGYFVARDEIRHLRLFHDPLILVFFFCSVVTVVLTPWYDVEIIADAIKWRRSAGMVEEPSSRLAEGLVWFAAICLSLWILPTIAEDSVLFRHGLGNSLLAIGLQLMVVVFDGALIIRAVSMYRTRPAGA